MSKKLILQRYSPKSIRNYKSAVKSFLETLEKKISRLNKLDEEMIEKYVPWSSKNKTLGVLINPATPFAAQAFRVV